MKEDKMKIKMKMNMKMNMNMKMIMIIKMKMALGPEDDDTFSSRALAAVDRVPHYGQGVPSFEYVRHWK